MIVAKEEKDSCEVSMYLPESVRKALIGVEKDGVYEIRLRRGKAVCLTKNDGVCFLGKNRLTHNEAEAVTVSSKELEGCFERLCEYSAASVSDELSKGYITIRGGHRVGVCGRRIGTAENPLLAEIQSLNFRLAREVVGCSDSVYERLINQNRRIRNTLIISPPLCGKTTILRDIARRLSEDKYRVSVVDTRDEIAASYKGQPSLDIGLCDVLSGVERAAGMSLMLRSMSPDVILTDEIGSTDDIKAISGIITSGVSIIATVHAESSKQLSRKAGFQALLPLIECIITLGNGGKIKGVEILC